MAIRRLVHAPLPPSKFLEDSVLTTPSYSKINRVNYGIQEPANIPAVLTFSTTARPIMRTPLESSIYYREPQPFSLTPSTPRYIAQRPVYDYDYPDIHPIRFEHSQPQYKGLKNGVLVHSTGALECLDQGTFPHPASCRRFVVCSRMQRGPLVGWQYTCPKGLSYDPVGGICNWAAGLGCKD
ncbi:uncharacterized protein LOC113381827 [Ctenocephalides felis]|uniref:uncharacterized protein LOC113381827 n=1 Tax=Ctenocephalides felis TaxID=7515 RepID=UPI000E6E1C16|nr:uncharacterized protein LOC113381827 [Ctenocephalides felis]